MSSVQPQHLRCAGLLRAVPGWGEISLAHDLPRLHEIAGLPGKLHPVYLPVGNDNPLLHESAVTGIEAHCLQSPARRLVASEVSRRIASSRTTAKIFPFTFRP